MTLKYFSKYYLLCTNMYVQYIFFFLGKMFYLVIDQTKIHHNKLQSFLNSSNSKILKEIIVN